MNESLSVLNREDFKKEPELFMQAVQKAYDKDSKLKRTEIAYQNGLMTLREYLLALIKIL